eukprot:scaffold65057_cov50-Prasinocladus_malaysianus.AAC.3
MKLEPDFAVARQASRVGPELVPEDIMYRMANNLEAPEGGGQEFGQPAIRLQMCDNGDDKSTGESFLCDSQGKPVSVADVWGLIMDSWGSAPRPLLSSEQRADLQAAGRSANAASLAHQVDLLSRQQLGAALRVLTERGAGKVERAQAAQRLNRCRKHLLNALKSGSHQDVGVHGGPNNDWAERIGQLEDAFQEACDNCLSNFKPATT